IVVITQDPARRNWMAARQTPAEPGFRGPIVYKLVGITYRQLDYWARTGLVTPSVRAADGSGTQRLYSFTDVVELRIIKRLLDAGVSLRQIREAIGYLRKESGGKPLSDVTLMSDGNRIYACHSNEEVVDGLSHGQAVFGLRCGPGRGPPGGRPAPPPRRPAGRRRAGHGRGTGRRGGGGRRRRPGPPPRRDPRAPRLRADTAPMAGATR